MPTEDHRALGVGLTYWPALAPLLAEHRGLVDVIEVQPESLWFSPSVGHPFSDPLSLARIGALEYPKVIHGVGNPVGGTCGTDSARQLLVNDVVTALGASLVTEHLSFNRSTHRGAPEQTGFMLPPRQTLEGVETAAASIRVLSEPLSVPFAVENGVSYLKPRHDEMPDGEFLAAVVEEADAGILLDLHNAYTNEFNGRQTMTEFLGQLPLDRVYELHVAGGRERDGFWLDAHSGAMPDVVASIAAELIPDLPNLRLINFEFLPAYLPDFGLDEIAGQLERCRRIWAARTSVSRPRNRVPAPAAPSASGPGAGAWERRLSSLVNPAARVVETEPVAVTPDLDDDPGVEVLGFLIGEFRAGMVTRAMTLTMRLLILHLGEEGVRRVLREFWETRMPAFFAVDEAEAFAAHVRAHGPALPHLDEMMTFELAVLRAGTDAESREVEFAGEPWPILGALTRFRLPPPPSPDRQSMSIEVEAPGSITISVGGRSEAERIYLDA